MDPSLYNYLPLHFERSIRLLELERTENSATEPLRGKIHEVNLEDPPSYIALSYVWGPSTPTESIEIEGRQLSITKSLSQTLHSVLPHLGDPWPTLVWTDAICINQSDAEERASQVRQMCYIYESAQIVWAWLGPRPPGLIIPRLRGIFDYISSSLSEAEKQKKGQRLSFEEGKANERKMAAVLVTEPGGLLNPGTRAAIETFFGLPWWDRMWIYQEATTTAPTILCYGGMVVSLPRATILSKLLISLRVTPVMDRYDSGYLRGMALHTMRSAREAGRQERLDELLRSFRDREATDPRDKVYAALGLVSDNSARNFKIDYSVGNTVSKVYRDFAVHLVDVYKRLDWLGSDTEVPWERDAELPSWVPDWRCRPMTRDLYKTRSDSSTNLQDVSNRLYNSDRGLSQDRIAVEGSLLKVEGVCVDIVNEVGPYAKEGHNNNGTEISWCPPQKLDIYKVTGETEHDAYLRTLTADVATEMGSNSASRGHKVDLTAVTSSSPNNDSDHPTTRTWQESAHLMDQMKRATTNRRFARTQHLNMMGLMPMFTETDDTVCVVTGCQVPLVIRSLGEGRWRLVGQAYLHGLMDGLAYELVQKNQREIETIVME